MKTYLLNSPVLSTYGQYRLSGPLSVPQAQALLREGFESAIGHEATACLLTELLVQPVLVARRSIEMNSGDRALVFRLLDRMPEGAVLQANELKQLRYELSLLEKLSD